MMHMPQPERASRSAALLDEALDTLAFVVRAFGRFGFDLENDRQGDLERECESLARRVLRGPTRDPDGAGSAADRGFGETRRFVDARRRNERAFVDRQVERLRGATSELLRGIKSLVDGERSSYEDVEAHVAHLEQALAAGRLDVLAGAVSTAVGGIRTVMARRQADFRTEMSRMGNHVSSLRADLETTRRDAQTDALTELHNRRAFDQMLDQVTLLNEGVRDGLLLLALDLDHFKKLNDTWGHAAGDAVLRAVADALVRTFPRRDDFVARVGGEEFAVVVRGADPETRDRLVDRVLRNLRELEVPYDGQVLRLTCSVGSAFWLPGEDAYHLMRRADAALYEAKRSGRDRAVHA